MWRAQIEEDARYTTWFGAPQDTSPTFEHPPRKEEVWDEGDFLPMHVSKAIYNRANSTDQFWCGCSDKVEATPVPAWTEASGTHLCSMFFRLPFEVLGADNQVGTIVHENAHHGDQFGPYVGDIPNGYGRAAARALALSDRTKAIINADNYSYFAESRYLETEAGDRSQETQP